MCAGDAARPIYSKLFSTHFEPLSALNLLQEDHIKPAKLSAEWSPPFPRRDIKAGEVSSIQDFSNPEINPKGLNQQIYFKLKEISIPNLDTCYNTEEDLINFQNVKLTSVCGDNISCGVNDDVESFQFTNTPTNERNANISSTITKIQTIPVENIQLQKNKIIVQIKNDTESKSNFKFKVYSKYTPYFRFFCFLSRRNVKNIHSSPPGKFKFLRRKFRKKPEFTIIDRSLKSEKNNFYGSKFCQQNNCPPKRIYRKYGKFPKKCCRQELFEVTSMYQSSMRSYSDLPAAKNKETSGSGNSNLRFSGKKPVRRNSLTQFSFNSRNKSQNETMITGRAIFDEPSTSSMEEYYSTKFKTNRKSGEYSKEAAKDAIKMIDKILCEPHGKYSKLVKSTSLDQEEPKYPARNETQFGKHQHRLRKVRSTDSESSSILVEVNEPRHRRTGSKEKTTTMSAIRKYSSSITRPSYLDLPNQHACSLENTTTVARDLPTTRMDGLNNYSLDGIIFGTDGRNDKHVGVKFFLERLDKVLSDLVEEETRKIVTLEIPGNHELYMDRQYVSSVSYKTNQSSSRESQSAGIGKTQARPSKPKRYKSSDYDMLERHKKCFTEAKPHKPRILMTNNSQSELLSLKSCYQVPKQKRRKTRYVKQNTEENATSYIDDFESNDSSSERNRESSSEHESNDDVISDFPQRKMEKDDYKTALSISKNRSRTHENVNSLYPNNNTVSTLSKYRVIGIKEPKQLEDDDTCYGSDQFGSDMMNDQLLPSKLRQRVKGFTRDGGENSVDSAYTGSREPTPDICSSGSEQVNTVSKLKYNALKNERVRSASFVNSSNTVVQRMNDAKLFLLEKIKDTGLYSDSHINSLLDYYSRKWHHIPEREMKIIANFIRRDLGVKAPPKTYIDYLLNQSDSSTNNGNFQDRPFDVDFTTQECVKALSSTLPNYLKSARDKRRAVSTSCSPEPSASLNSEESNLNNISRKSYRPSKLSTNPSFMTAHIQGAKFQSAIVDRGTTNEWESRQLDARTYESGATKCTETDYGQVLKHYGNSLLSSDYDDEEWIRNNIGDEILGEVKRTLLNSKAVEHNSRVLPHSKEVELNSIVLPHEVEEMANDLCERFGLVL